MSIDEYEKSEKSVCVSVRRRMPVAAIVLVRRSAYHQRVSKGDMYKTPKLKTALRDIFVAVRVFNFQTMGKGSDMINISTAISTALTAEYAAF